MSTPGSEWSVDDVCEQLDDLGVEGKSISLFREARVDGKRLLSMTEGDRRELNSGLGGNVAGLELR